MDEISNDFLGDLSIFSRELFIRSTTSVILCLPIVPGNGKAKWIKSNEAGSRADRSAAALSEQRSILFGAEISISITGTPLFENSATKRAPTYPLDPVMATGIN